MYPRHPAFRLHLPSLDQDVVLDLGSVLLCGPVGRPRSDSPTLPVASSALSVPRPAAATALAPGDPLRKEAPICTRISGRTRAFHAGGVCIYGALTWGP